MNHSHFSIVTPTILRPSLVRLCRTIETQSYPSWEHIVVIDLDEVDLNHGVLAEIMHPRRRILKCDHAHRNYGNTCRRNAYGEIAGNYVIYLDDDDYLADANVLRDIDAAMHDGVWALFPILRHGKISYSDSPIRGCSCSVVVWSEYAEWPDSQDYDADGKYIEKLLQTKRGKHPLPYQLLSEMRPLVVQPESGGIGHVTRFTHAGRDWLCRDEMVGGYHWIAESQEPFMRVTAGSWDQLVAGIKTTDPKNPRVDAIAVCDPLPLDFFTAAIARQ